jgi:membrane-bound lytic murein transglycosylase B
VAKPRKRRNKLRGLLVVASAAIALLTSGVRAQDPATPPPAPSQVEGPAPSGAEAPVPVTAESARSGVERRTFEDFLTELRIEALSRGIGQATLDAALAGLVPEPVVVARDRAQPEATLSLDQYAARRTGARTVAAGRAELRRHAGVLERVEASYGVSPAVVVAVWGLESNFGRFTGTYPTVKALATLAYDGRRPIFRRELFHALAILERGDVPLERLKGSWAGALGQPQFMPSSYLEHAVDFDADGRADIWASTPDVFGSMANYLRHAGWSSERRWGREVTIPRNARARIDRSVPMRREGCRAVRELSEPRPLTEWTALGVTLPGGGRLPSANVDASLVRGERRYFLAYPNYEALLSYNCSNAYAVSVGLLADKISIK